MGIVEQNALENRQQTLFNRLKKRDRHFQKWAKRTETNCYRVYDKDIPELPLGIDRYDQSLVVYDYSQKEQECEPKIWCDVIADALSVKSSSVFWKRRTRQKGIQQYEKLGFSDRRECVIENGYKFWVNLRDYLDTGLFMDHRITRDLSTQNMANRSMLNLFAYTGSFSVYGAIRGASQVTTVDLSNTYLDWAKSNFLLNELDPTQHVFIQDDAIEWLGFERKNEKKYDLIICDPPTFSNSKRMRDNFEVERNQLALFQGCHRRLKPDGVLWWSTNKRRFRLSDIIFELFDVEEMTQRTQPEDYRQRPHRSWRMTRRGK